MPLSVQQEGTRRITLSTETGPVFTYNCGEELWKPFLHPIWSPSGTVLTDNAPHHAPGHRGVFFGWADVNGVDFWNEGREGLEHPQGRIATPPGGVNLEVGKDRIQIHADHEWQRPDGSILLHDTRTLAAMEPEEPGWQVIDWKSVIRATEEDVILGNVQKSMGLSYCASEEMNGGHFINSRQVEGNATNGRAAEWCDYSGPEREGPLAGGLTIMASRRNPHPRPEFFTQSEPFGFMSASFAYRAPFIIKAGETVTLLYRLVLHDDPGDAMLLHTYYTAFLWG